MGNNVGQDITGKFVLLHEDWFRESLQEHIKEHPEERVFLALGGFGCSPDTMGNAVFGMFVVDGEECRVEGYNLDNRLATKAEVEAALEARDKRRLGGTSRLLLALSAMKED